MAASLIDWVGFWVLAWIGLGVLAKAIGAVGGETARQSSLVPMVIVIYVLGYYNVGLQQSRTGQSWGKRILGIRLVKMTDLRPPSKLDLTFRPVIGFFEMLSGVGILSMLLSRYRQSFGDRFSGTVVLDESRAGMTPAWVLPGEPVIDPGPRIPEGGVPRPERRRRVEPADSGPPPWARSPDPEPEPFLDDEETDLPEREFGDERPVHRRPPAPRDDLPVPGAHVERDPIGELRLPRGFGRTPEQRDRSTPPPPPVPDPAPAEAPLPSGGLRYLTDPTIAEALRARDTDTAHQRARACIDQAFERGEAIHVDEAIAEFRSLVTSAGLAIRASDDNVATWLGLN